MTNGELTKKLETMVWNLTRTPLGTMWEEGQREDELKTLQAVLSLLDAEF